MRRTGKALMLGAASIVALLVIGGFSSTAVTLGEDCDVSKTVTLWAGQNMDVGDVTIWHDASNIYVKFTTEGGWWLSETHVAAGDALSDIPQTNSGNPKVGLFPYAATHDPMVQTYTYTIPFADIGYDQGETLVIAAHAVVKELGGSGYVVDTQTGWGDGEDFPGRNWAMYIEYTPCKVLRMPDDAVGINFDPGASSYFSTVVSSGGNDVPSGTYIGWCVDENHFVDYTTNYQATLYSSYDPNLPSCAQSTNWDVINYILNQKTYYSGLGYDKNDITQAFWYLTGDRTWAQIGSDAQAIVTNALANGEGYYPGHGEWMAIVVFIDCNHQLTIIEVDP